MGLKELEEQLGSRLDRLLKSSHNNAFELVKDAYIAFTMKQSDDAIMYFLKAEDEARRGLAIKPF